MPENKTIGDLDAIDQWDRVNDLIELEDSTGPSGKKSSPQKLMDDVPSREGDAGSMSGEDFVKLNALAKLRVRALASANVSTSTPGATIDSVSLTSGDRVLLTAQSAGAENGLWIWNGASSALTRPSDADATEDYAPGALVYVQEGASWSETFWMLSTTAAITPDTTSQAWKLFASSGVITDDDFSGTYFGALFRLSDGVYSAVKYAVSASGPTVNDDDTQGYVQGSVWFDSTAKAFYDCTDNSTGAAVWATRGGGAFDPGSLDAATPALDDKPVFADTDDADAAKRSTWQLVLDLIGSLASKATPAAADTIAITDTDAGSVAKKTTITGLANRIASIFGLIYATGTGDTTDNTAGVATTCAFTPADGKASSIFWVARGYKDDGAQGMASLYYAAVRRVGGTVTEIGTSTTAIVNKRDDSAWASQISIDGTTVTITVTGNTGDTIAWEVTVLGFAS